MTIVARWFLLISGPRVRVPGGALDIERQIVRFDAPFRYVTLKIRGLHGQCTVFARLAFSWESSAWAGITLKCVVNFASGQQSQTALSLYLGVSVLQKFQQSSHGDGRFACGGYSLRAGTFLFGVETFLKLPAQFYTRGLLDMGVGVYKDNADTIIGNMDTSIFLGGKEPTTLKELAAVLGKETIDTYNTGENRGRETSHSLNYQKLGKELMSQDELAVMDGGKCILQLRGVRPFLSDKYDITKHPNYPYTADADPKNAFDIEAFLSTRLKLKPNEVYDVYEVDAEGA